MMTLLMAAAIAAQPVPPADAHGQMSGMPQHEGMKKDCCKDCCKDMAGKHDGEMSDHHGEHHSQ